MLLGAPQTIATALSILGFYGLDRILIGALVRRAGRSRRADDSYWVMMLITALLLALQPLLLPWLSFRTAATWGLWCSSLASPRCCWRCCCWLRPTGTLAGGMPFAEACWRASR